MARSRLDSVRALATLGFRDRPTARLAVRALIIAVRLRRNGLRPVMAGLDPDLPLADLEQSRRISADLDRAMAALPMEATCLRRSAALLTTLDRQGRSAELVIGVRTDDEPSGFGAHAWVEVDGSVVNDEADIRDKYAVIATGTDLHQLPSGLR